MQFSDFSEMNRRRCEHANGFNHRVDSWSLSDWFMATMRLIGFAYCDCGSGVDWSEPERPAQERKGLKRKELTGMQSIGQKPSSYG